MSLMVCDKYFDSLFKFVCGLCFDLFNFVDGVSFVLICPLILWIVWFIF